MAPSLFFIRDMECIFYLFLAIFKIGHMKPDGIRRMRKTLSAKFFYFRQKKHFFKHFFYLKLKDPLSIAGRSLGSRVTLIHIISVRCLIMLWLSSLAY
ncbi:hypothetical protein BRADI_5g16748v3 [Brachypodium distachyon]|uniref:Uncharacterized protein n=1 Tax=Brachypodium distachyon TaxID=15368 RepID=A0A0Q3E7D9_BRADI|nr:hypothetical protein BRADI_5g16748v3 [Brachypodium distachyon]